MPICASAAPATHRNRTAVRTARKYLVSTPPLLFICSNTHAIRRIGSRHKSPARAALQARETAHKQMKGNGAFYFENLNR